jgi:hypothetical protein
MESKLKKIRCKICNRKISLTYIECRCGNMFCGIHRYPVEHNCNFDHKKFQQDKIKLHNPIIKKDKFEKI